MLNADHKWNLKRRIRKSSSSLYLSAVGTDRDESLQFYYPPDIANNKVYVIENGNKRVQVLNSNLSFHRLFGESGSGKENLVKT